jgi:hypothetical protein
MVVEGREEVVKESAVQVARLMALSAITAPKARGVDNVVVGVLKDRAAMERLAEAMEKMAEQMGDFFKRDADNIRRSTAVVLIGCKIKNIDVKTPPGYSYDLNFVLNILNLGIAVGSEPLLAQLVWRSSALHARSQAICITTRPLSRRALFLRLSSPSPQSPASRGRCLDLELFRASG